MVLLSLPFKLTICYDWSIISFPSSEASVIQGLPEETENISLPGPWTRAGYGTALALPVLSNLPWAGLMRALRSLQSSPERTQRHDRKLRPKCPRIKNFTQQGSTAVPSHHGPHQGRAALTPVDPGLRRRCKASAPYTHTWAGSSWSGAKEAFLGTDSLWKPNPGSSFRQVSSHLTLSW